MKVGTSNRLALTINELAAIILLSVFLIYIAVGQYYTIRENIAEISCRSVRKSINRALESYKTENPGSRAALVNKNIDIEKLIKAGNLKYFPKCWDGGMYRVNEKGVVYCTYHNPELGD